MPLHIGIMACSAEGAAECYRTICAEAAEPLGPHGNPPVSLHMPSLADYVRHLEAGNLQGVANLMQETADRLASAGADFLVCPDNTIHQALPALTRELPLPFLHIAETVADEAHRRGFRHLGLTGTRWLVQSDVYGEALGRRGIALTLPMPDEREEMNRIIMDELVYGRFTSDAERAFQRILKRMGDAGCDAVVLGCTEIPLLINEKNAPLPVLDSTRLLARAALRHAVEERLPGLNA
jgi:aspartate racemase